MLESCDPVEGESAPSALTSSRKLPDSIDRGRKLHSVVVLPDLTLSEEVGRNSLYSGMRETSASRVPNAAAHTHDAGQPASRD